MISVLFVVAVLTDIGFGATTEFSAKQNYLLPWQIIAEKFHEECWFGAEGMSPNNGTRKYKILRFGRVNSNSSYTCLPAQPIIIRLPEKAVNLAPLKKITVKISKLVGDSWINAGGTIICSGSDEIRITEGIGKDGFYKLNFSFITQSGQQQNHEVYTVVCSNWKKDVLAFCREIKEEIELNPDSLLIRSCIAISHFDHTMEMVSKSSFLSVKILNALADAVRSKQVFDNGQCPDFVRGLNKIRIKRFEGAPVEVFTVFVPACYESTKAWPVFLHIVDTGWSFPNDYPPNYGLIDMCWHNVSHKKIRWKEYITVMELVKKKLHIDENRIYIDGECANGIPAIALALHHPDYWAECSVSLGNSYRHLSGNALNLPLIMVKGRYDEDSFVGYYDFAVKCFQYHGCRHFKESRIQEIAEVRGSPVPVAVRMKNPARILYTIESLGNPQAYWVQIKGREDENLIGTIDANIEGQTVIIKTANIDAYSLDLTQAPLDTSRSVEIVENGRSLGFITNGIFTKKNEKYSNATFIKSTNLHGPVSDAFTEPYVVVWGSGNKVLVKENERAAKRLANGGLCFSDSNVPNNLIESKNLILVGTPESNTWLQKIFNQLPVRIEGNRLTADVRNYEQADFGLILIYPNPLNYQKYIAVFSGTSLKAIQKIYDAYSIMKTIRPADVGIFEVTDSGSIKWHLLEKFNTVWDWHADWGKILFNVNSINIRWKWHHWIAKTVRNEVQADVVFCEDPFIFKNLLPDGQVAYRDLFNIFKNIWFIKVEMNGKVLRPLLTVPINDISLRKAEMPIVEGVSLSKFPANMNDSILAINDIEDDTLYSVVLPERCLNGTRLGVLVENYKIIGNYHLLPLLKDYFNKNNNINMNTQLDNIKPNLF